MGSCISKFNKKSHEQQTQKNVQDKLVISQAPKSFSTPQFLPETPKPPYPSPLSPTSSTSASSTFSSFYCATSTNSTSRSNVSLSSSSSSSSSLSSSIICPKERSTFSNEYLMSCVQENPQVIKGKIERFRDQTPMPNKSTCGTKLRNHISTQGKPIVSSPMQYDKAKKRSRANYPNLTRQKSFRKEPLERPSTPSRIIRSPSPTRRFNSENWNYKATSVNQTPKYKRQPFDLKENSRFNYNAAEKENISRITKSPKNLSSNYVGVNRMNEYSSHQIGEDLPADHEDISNPHIALDCFIFL